MKRKPIKIDWDAVDEAFNNPNEELVYYLDLVTGHVGLEGEGEEDDFDDEDVGYESSASTRAAAPRRDTTRLYVEPPDDARKIEWMKAFLREDGKIDPELAAQIEEAFTGPDPSDEVTDVLHDYPEVRDRWFAYRNERLRELIDGWLETNDVEMTEKPPWRG